MNINHNLSAMFADRPLQVTQNSPTKSIGEAFFGTSYQP
jgi:hypothetical protein